MARAQVKDPTVIRIPNGSNVSNPVVMSEWDGMTAFTLFAPSLTDAHAYVIQVTYDGITYVTLNDGTSDVVAPSSGKAIAYPNPPCYAWRIKDNTGNVSANADFYMWAEVPIFGLN